jgi:RND superfamily putative drug exporter
MLASSGGAARFVVVEKTDPLDATAISRVRQLQQDLPALGRGAGLTGARYELAGETALTGDSIGSVFADLGRVALAIMAVTLVLLALFLRSLLAPVYLLAASVLAVFATLGLTILIGQDILGYGSLVYFVPFAAGVLLVSLGSDYNVFVVGRIWEEARRRPVRDAVAVAAPQASRAITTAQPAGPARRGGRRPAVAGRCPMPAAGPRSTHRPSCSASSRCPKLPDPTVMLYSL